MTSDTDNPNGGGSGGETAPRAITTHPQFVDGRHSIAANQIELLSRDPVPGAGVTPHKCVITLLAANNPAGLEGQVDIRGAKGVRVTTGPAAVPGLSPSVSGESTDGVEIVVSPAQSIKIHRGLAPEVSQVIELTPTGILIDAGLNGTLTLSAGLNSIVIDPTQGITIVGLPYVQINPLGPPPAISEPGDYEMPDPGAGVPA